MSRRHLSARDQHSMVSVWQQQNEQNRQRFEAEREAEEQAKRDRYLQAQREHWVRMEAEIAVNLIEGGVPEATARRMAREETEAAQRSLATVSPVDRVRAELQASGAYGHSHPRQPVNPGPPIAVPGNPPQTPVARPSLPAIVAEGGDLADALRYLADRAGMSYRLRESPSSPPGGEPSTD